MIELILYLLYPHAPVFVVGLLIALGAWMLAAIMFRMGGRGIKSSMEQTFTHNMKDKVFGEKYADQPQPEVEPYYNRYKHTIDKFNHRFDLTSFLYMWIKKGYPVYPSVILQLCISITATLVISFIAIVEIIIDFMYTRIKRLCKKEKPIINRKPDNSIYDKEGMVIEVVEGTTKPEVMFVPTHIKMFK